MRLLVGGRHRLPPTASRRSAPDVRSKTSLSPADNCLDAKRRAYVRTARSMRAGVLNDIMFAPTDAVSAEARRSRQARDSGERSERRLDVTEHFRMLSGRSGPPHRSKQVAATLRVTKRSRGSDPTGRRWVKRRPESGGRSPFSRDP